MEGLTMDDTPQEISSDPPIPQTDMSWIQSMIQHARQRNSFAARVSTHAEVVGPPLPLDLEVLLQAAIILTGDKTQEGVLVQGVSVAWEEIIRWLSQDPDFLFKISWRKLEELIAGAYEREGWSEVILTPRSGDRGRDIIATRTGIGSIRFYDQVKRYRPGHIVKADEVRAMLGVLTRDQNVSKALVTTTSQFAPGVFEELRDFMPYRLELKGGAQLLEWLQQIRKSRGSRREN
jgi:restriction system protein